MNLSEIKKSFNAKFPKATVKIECLDGTYRPLRDGYGNTIRAIPTYVQRSPIDASSVKDEKIQKVLVDIIQHLVSLGGFIKTQSTSHAIVEFTKPNSLEVKYIATIFKEEHRATHIYDEGYKNVFFSVDIEKV